MAAILSARKMIKVKMWKKKMYHDSFILKELQMTLVDKFYKFKIILYQQLNIQEHNFYLFISLKILIEVQSTNNVPERHFYFILFYLIFLFWPPRGMWSSWARDQILAAVAVYTIALDTLTHCAGIEPTSQCCKDAANHVAPQRGCQHFPDI